MREIKFRAWHKKRKRWYHVSHWHKGDAVDSITNLAGFNRDETLFVGEDIALMQYTGQEDKNGKEIYEGDIGKPRSRFTSTLWVAYWDERVCQFRVCANGDRQFDKTHTVDWIDEVIGNIYENPELLGTKETT